MVIDTWPAKVSVRIDSVPGAQAPQTRVRVGLLGPAFAWRRCLYHSVSLSASPLKGREESPDVPILGRMIQVVLLVWDCWRLGGGVGVLEQADGVDCFAAGLGWTILAAADTKEIVLCLAPGLHALAAAIWYC